MYDGYVTQAETAYIERAIDSRQNLGNPAVFFRRRLAKPLNAFDEVRSTVTRMVWRAERQSGLEDIWPDSLSPGSRGQRHRLSSRLPSWR